MPNKMGIKTDPIQRARTLQNNRSYEFGNCVNRETQRSTSYLTTKRSLIFLDCGIIKSVSKDNCHIESCF